MLRKIKLLLGINDEDDLLRLLIQMAEEEVKSFYHIEDTDGLENVIIMMVVEKYNKMGSEGIVSKSYTGVRETVNSDYSEPIMKILRANRRLRTI